MMIYKRSLWLIVFTVILSFQTNSIEKDPDFKTDITKKSINLDDILSGGPGKDGIPALNNPKFIKISETNIPKDSMGALVVINNQVRFYPYSILVWHEIVNDSIDDVYFTVTFCPLCGTAIVFNRKINDKIHKFGVSGYLYESNLLMYDNITESLWSQSLGNAVVGEYTGYSLSLIDVNLLDFSYVKDNYPNAVVLSSNTGFSRNYNLYPYGNYETNDKIFFPISKRDSKYHLKELMYVFRYKDVSFTFPVKDLKNKEYIHNGEQISIKDNKGLIEIFINGKEVPGYYEMWFSWNIHNSGNGVVIDLE